ncbi:RHS repeat-associated core domain-containing protein [Pseudomonas sp. MWU16-30317]|uniref:RHS repeat-associated core domain-containing protein n=1 Tax=Pseudomonas sp. MWU16-30317 TaxID=2878095 RepID=UPI001CFB70FF
MDTSKSCLLLGDARQTVMGTAGPTARPLIAHSAYGWRRPAAGLPALGFTGQRAEVYTQWYHLGHGHREYNPVLRRFHSPDRASPFGAGGVNAYAYCLGDPVNYRDPSGARVDLPDWMADSYGPSMAIAINLVGTTTVILSALTAETLTPLAIGGAWGAAIGGILAVTALSVGMARKNDGILLLGYIASGVSLAGGVARLGVAINRYRKLPDPGPRVRRNARRLFGLAEKAVPASPVPIPRASDVLPATPAPSVQTPRPSELPYLSIYPDLQGMKLQLERMSASSWRKSVPAPRPRTPLPADMLAIRGS